MTSGTKCIVYYSAFRLPIQGENDSISRLQPFYASIKSLLPPTFPDLLQDQLELLNVPEASESLELLTKIWLGIKSQQADVNLSEFLATLVSELQLQRGWNPLNSACSTLSSLLENLLPVLEQVWSEQLVDFRSGEDAGNKESQYEELTPLITIQEKEIAGANGSKVERAHAPPTDIGTSKDLRKWLVRCSDFAKSKMQVTREFVTQVAEVAWRSDSTRLRLIQPCRVFYQVAVDSWLRLGDTATPSKFVNSLRTGLGPTWTESLIKPCLHFFKIARNDWELYQEDPSIGFQERVRASLKKIWDVSIVESCRSLASAYENNRKEMRTEDE